MTKVNGKELLESKGIEILETVQRHDENIYILERGAEYVLAFWEKGDGEFVTWGYTMQGDYNFFWGHYFCIYGTATFDAMYKSASEDFIERESGR